MWTIIGKLFCAIFGSLVDVALKLFEVFKKKPEEIVREQHEKDAHTFINRLGDKSDDGFKLSDTAKSDKWGNTNPKP